MESARRSMESARRSIAVAVATAVVAAALLAAAADGRAQPPSYTDKSAVARTLTIPFSVPKLHLPFNLGKSKRPADEATTVPPQTPPLRENGPRDRPTADNGRAGVTDDPRAAVRTANGTATTVGPKTESSTHDRSIITAQRKTCPEGQRMSPDRVCRTGFDGPEDDDEE